MAWWYGLNLTCPHHVAANRTVLFLCANGHCINTTYVCDGRDHCGDGSDEDVNHAQCLGDGVMVSGTVIAGIVIGTVVGIAILCCLVGTIVDCFVHIYKYWCSCLHKAYHNPLEMVALRGASGASPRRSPSDPGGGAMVIVRAVPPNYSTVITRCDSPPQTAMRSEYHQRTLGTDSSTKAPDLDPNTIENETYHHAEPVDADLESGLKYARNGGHRIHGIAQCCKTKHTPPRTEEYCEFKGYRKAYYSRGRPRTGYYQTDGQLMWAHKNGYATPHGDCIIGKKAIKKRDLLGKVSRAAIRDCIPDLDSDLESDEDDSRMGMIIKNKHTFLTLESNDPVLHPQNCAEMQYNQQRLGSEMQYSPVNSMVDVRDKSIGTSTGDLRYICDSAQAKALMVSKDIQTDDIVSSAVDYQSSLPPYCSSNETQTLVHNVPNHVGLPSYQCFDTNQTTHQSYKSSHSRYSDVAGQTTFDIDVSETAKSKSGSEPSCSHVADCSHLPPSYSSIFQGGNLIQLSEDLPCCNGVVELPPKEKPPD